MVEYVTQEEMNEELGVEFVEYMNRLFGETYEIIKDEPKNVIMDAGLKYFQNKV